MKLTEEQRKIVEDNHNLIYKYCNRNNLDIDEWYGDLAIVLCEAVKLYDKNKGCLSTYVYNAFKNRVINIYRDNTRKLKGYKLLSYNNIIRNEDNINNIELENKISKTENDIDSFILKNVVRENKIGMLVVYGYKHREISKILNLSNSQLIRKIKKFKRQLKEQLTMGV